MILVVNPVDYFQFQSTLSLRRATGSSSAGDWRYFKFQSTLSLRRATLRPLRHHRRNPISIHALLAESDQFGTIRANVEYDFNPRSPCGERLRNGIDSGYRPDISIHALLAESDGDKSLIGKVNRQFQSTLSLRRATRSAGPCWI